MVAADAGNPPKSASAVVQIEILHNFYEPQFLAFNYTTTILETMPLGQSILRVRAEDIDVKVRRGNLCQQGLISGCSGSFAVGTFGLKAGERRQNQYV